MPVRVVLAEDHQIIREGLRAVLTAAPEIELLGTYADYDELLAAVDEHVPDVVLTDIRMPPGMSDEGDPDRRTAAADSSADGCGRPQPTRRPRLRDGPVAGRQPGTGLSPQGAHSRPGRARARLVEVAGGGSVIDPKVVEVLVRARLRTESSPLQALTERERDVLAQMATGKGNAAIAAALVLTVRSVEKYINGIFSKLGLSRGARHPSPGQGRARLPLRCVGTGPPTGVPAPIRSTGLHGAVGEPR